MSKVSINTQKIVEDLSVLGSMVVASSEVAEQNIKTLLRELETKRGDRDANALADATAKAAAVHTTIAPACVGLAETHLGPLDDALQAVIAMVHTQVGLEDARNQARATALAQLAARENATRAAFAEDIEHKREAFDAEIEAEAARIRAKYAAPLSSSDSSSPPQSGGEADGGEDGGEGGGEGGGEDGGEDGGEGDQQRVAE